MLEQLHVMLFSDPSGLAVRHSILTLLFPSIGFISMLSLPQPRAPFVLATGQRTTTKGSRQTFISQRPLAADRHVLLGPRNRLHYRSGPKTATSDEGQEMRCG